uniref:Protein G7c n=1 Tax=Magallana gigas TaxID=29159 RepID=K1QNT8_MAGGI
MSSDGYYQSIFYQNILKITDHQNIVQKELASFAHYHVNGEQILTAHNYVRSLRRSLIDLAQSRPDIDILRERVGQCLYTLQQFYSNTNWVELHGDTIIKEFGISATLPVSISNLSDEPCSDCPTDLTSGLCKNNTITTKLTSGYKSEQDIPKPLSNNQGIGKCSHGSQDDTSRLKSATGGIYKGRSSSANAPHFYLHNEAFEAAKLATIYFLSDEIDLEENRVTNDADEMISWINGLTVSGGDDCPEYSLSGLITDRYKRQSSVYDSIAQATGGDVERFSSSQELADKVEEDLMNELSIIQSNSSQAIYQSPPKGQWTLEYIGSNPLTINVTASSSFDISSYLREISSEGFFYPISCNPVLDKEYAIVVLLENIPANSSISSIVLVDDKGNVVTTIVANLLSVTPNLQYFAKTKFYKQIAGVQIHGQDSASQQFIRTSKHTINPVDVTLTMKPFIGDLSLSNLEQLEFTITNHGRNNKSLTLDVSDDRGYIVDNRSIQLHIPPGESENKQVFIRGTHPLTIVTVTTSLKDEETQIVLQKLTKKLTVSSAMRPTCNFTSLGDTCQNQRGNGSNCYDVIWQGSARVNYFGVGIASLDVSNSSNIITDSSDPIDKKETVLNLTILGAAIGVALAGIVILTIGVFLKIRHSSLKSSKVKDDTDIQIEISRVEKKKPKNNKRVFRWKRKTLTRAKLVAKQQVGLPLMSEVGNQRLVVQNPHGFLLSHKLRVDQPLNHQLLPLDHANIRDHRLKSEDSLVDNSNESSVEMNAHGKLFFHHSGEGIEMKTRKRSKPKHAYKIHSLRTTDRNADPAVK